jgi:hypothetical protein
MPDQWQISFDHGHQQRYLPDRRAVLSYVLSIGPRAASPRFEVFVESKPPLRSGRRPPGRAFSRVDVIDLSRPGEVERLRAELAELGQPAEMDRPGRPGAAGSPS